MTLKQTLSLILAPLLLSMTLLTPRALASPGLEAIKVKADQNQDKKAEADRLTEQGIQQYKISQFEAAVQSWQQTLKLYREVQDKSKEVITLRNLGNAYNALSNSPKAIEYHEKSLMIARELQDRQAEANALGNLGTVYRNLSHYPKAIELYEQSLAISRELKSRKVEGIALGNLGSTYFRLGNYLKAIEFQEQGLAIARELQDRQREGIALGDLGSAFFSLGDYRKTINYQEKSLVIAREIKDKRGEGNTLNNLGNAHHALGNYAKSIEFYEYFLAIAREIKDKRGEGNTLNNLGNAYFTLRKYPQAIELYEQSLVITREVKDKQGEGNALGNLGIAYKSLGNYPKAIELYEQSLTISQLIKDRQGEASSLNNLGNIKKYEQPQLAILFYKKSINTYESIREDISSLPRFLQETYTQSISKTYRDLADLLIQEGRLPEAQQVLELLKLRELKDLKKDKSTISPDLKLSFTSSEDILLKKPNHSIVNTKVLSQSSGIKNINLDLTNPFNRSAKSLVSSQPGTALIYYLMTQNKLWILAITPDGKMLSIAVPVSEKELRESVKQFRQQIENCENQSCQSKDTTKINRISRTLHNWLMPIALKGLLQNAKVTRLSFALDSVTRYLPIEALYDGNQYLIQNYSVSVIISTYLTDSQERLKNHPKVLAMGLSNSAIIPLAGINTPKSDRFNPLINVPQELTGIVGNPSNNTYSGLSFLNQEFTLSSLNQNIPNYNILHLATHGIFRADNLDASYIVLGDGTALTIPMIDSRLSSLSNIHLVVLSACQTGLGGANQDGVEISGISNAFLSKGAKSVAATLWQVNDNSTSQLMQRFYQNLSLGTMTKAEALQKAQLTLIGKNTTTSDDLRGSIKFPSSNGAKSVIDRDLSHPYYWASFILIGNSL